jgi:hypothetical protein
MSSGEIITIIIMAVLVAILVGLLIIDDKNKKFVLKNSERIKNLIALNETIYFSILQPSYSNHQVCNSKRQLENFSINDYLIALIDSNESFYRNIIEKIDKNITTYNEYIKQVQVIKSTATEDFCNQIKFKYNKFIRYENRVFKSKILRKPQMEVTIHCKATYTSPAGRNHYWKNESYTFNELKRYFEYTIKLKEQRQTRQYQIKVERAKMTDSLRYDILKRDNFRCQICGSSAQDGVKLHVDHIVPVAKGGQTIRSNLRTLCDRCNMGKSDKM